MPAEASDASCAATCAGPGHVTRAAVDKGTAACLLALHMLVLLRADTDHATSLQAPGKHAGGMLSAPAAAVVYGPGPVADASQAPMLRGLEHMQLSSHYTVHKVRCRSDPGPCTGRTVCVICAMSRPDLNSTVM
jgi:hypothetical protein